MTAKELMSCYEEVREKEKINGELCLITNPKAKTGDNSKTGGILLVGMNPSGKGQGDVIKDYKDCNDGFWISKHSMMGIYDEKCGYIDLLPFRNGTQTIARDNDEIRYRGELLCNTRDYIEELCPRLIIFANKTANYYWGFNKKKPWMGYTFQEIESPLDGERKYWKLFQITGIEPTDVNRNVNETNLKGTYFLQYRQHNNRNRKTVSEERVLRFEDIRTIAKFIDEKWEKTLY